MYPDCSSMYIPAHGRTGRRRSRASDISSLVRGDGKEPAKRDAPKHSREQGFSSYSCSCSGAYPSWTWRTCTKGTCRGMCCLTQKAEDGTGADRVTHTQSHADGQDGGEQDPDSPICFPFCRARYGSGIPGIPVGTQGIQPAAGSTQAMPGNAVGTQHLQPDTPGHNGLPLRDTPRIISEAMGHSSITVTETYLKPFSNRRLTRPTRG